MEITQIISVTVALTGLLAGAVGTLASKKKDLIIDTLTKDNVVTKDYNKTLEATLATRTAQRDGLQQRVNDNKTLPEAIKQIQSLTQVLTKLIETLELRIKQ